MYQKRFIQNSIECLLRKSSQKPPNLKVNQQIIDEILNLRGQIYYDFNISHFREKLKEIYGKFFKLRDLRQILLKVIYTSKGQKDFSFQDRWLEHISKP